MATSSMSAAKRICQSTGWTVSNLALQKLLYIAHMIFMGQHNGQPLISEEFEAWDYGPVLPRVYHRVKGFGSAPVGNVFHSVPDILDDSDEAKMLDEVGTKLGKLPAGKLVAATHWEKGAWSANYVAGQRFVVIPNNDILEEYRNRFNATAG